MISSKQSIGYSFHCLCDYYNFGVSYALFQYLFFIYPPNFREEATLSSTDTAYRIVHKAYEKILIELAIDEYIHIVELRRTKKTKTEIVYEYCADHNNDWGGKFAIRPAMTITMLPTMCTPIRKAVSSSPQQEIGLSAKLQRNSFRRRLSYRLRKFNP